MIRLLALLLASTPAYAQTAHQWGSNPAFTLELIPGEGGAHVATVIAHNELIAVGNVVTATLDGGLLVTVEMGAGDIPDVVIVTAPEGYIALPARLSLEEGETGEVRVFRLSDMVMG